MLSMECNYNRKIWENKMETEMVVKLIVLLSDKKEITHEPQDHYKSLEKHGLCIVVIDNGFVFIGECETTDKWVIINDARPIIRWGTSQGLSELANRGPLTNTNIGATQITVNKTPFGKLINIIPCNKENWA